VKTLYDNLRPARLAWLTALLGALAGANAGAESTYDPKLLALLPPYCKYTQLYRDKVAGADDATQIQHWINTMGLRNYLHMHHFCWGLENTNRALYFSGSKLERDRELAASVGEFDYVIDRVAPDFVLLPEILARRGENLLRLGNGPRGLLDLTRAIELKPDHWPPYAALSDYYKSLGDFGSAREWAEKGLAAAPGTKALQRRLAELDKPRARATPSGN
jgi:tetratricopeptide (TPR) repeat protein